MKNLLSSLKKYLVKSTHLVIYIFGKKVDFYRVHECGKVIENTIMIFFREINVLIKKLLKS